VHSSQSVTTPRNAPAARRSPQTNTWRIDEVKDASVDGAAVWVKLPGSYVPPQAETTLHVPCESEAAARELARSLGFEGHVMY